MNLKLHKLRTKIIRRLNILQFFAIWLSFCESARSTLYDDHITANYA